MPNPIVVMVPTRQLFCPLCRGPVRIVEETPIFAGERYHCPGASEGERVATKYDFECMTCAPLLTARAVIAWG